MKRNSYIFISLLLSVVLFTSCITEDEYDNSPEGNFEALWQTIDRQYCFLDYKKQEYGLDWNEIYSQYKQRISKGMNNEQLFEVLADMLNELRDGHVNRLPNWSTPNIVNGLTAIRPISATASNVFI